MKRIYELAKRLTALPGVSGDEQRALGQVRELLRGFFDEIFCTPVSSLWGVRRSKNPSAGTILLDAHLDTVGFVVTKICDGGFLKVAPIGRIAEKNLPASEVWIYGEQTIPGVFAAKPPHLQEPGESEKKLSLSDFAIDTGCTRETLETLVHVGTYVGFRAEAELLNDHIAVSPSFDDRLCAAAHLRALELLGEEDVGVHIAFQFSAREEQGYKGAMTTAYRVHPDMAIVMDVGHAYVPGAPEKRKTAVAGKGCLLSYAPQTSRRLTVWAEQVAKAEAIPVQPIAEPGRTGTNSNAVQTSHGGIPVCLLSVPLKNMHTANEVADLRDARAAADLVAALLRRAATEQEELFRHGNASSLL